MMQRRTVAVFLGAVCAWVLLGAMSWVNVRHGQEYAAVPHVYQDNDRVETIAHTLAKREAHNGQAHLSKRYDVDHRPLSRRAPALTNPTLFKSAKERGQKLICGMARPQNAPQSDFSKIEDLQTWGWTSVKKDDDQAIHAITWSIDYVMEAERFDDDAPPNVIYELTHSEQVKVGDVTYPPTGAEYQNLFNPDEGLIIAYHNFGPAYQAKAKSDLRGVQLPKLQRWSDTTYLTWASITTPQQRADLKAVIRYNIIGEQQKSLIRDALISEGVENGVPPPWPGHTFAAPDDPAEDGSAWEAMVGSPNVLGVAWMLIQHAHDLGDKVIHSITVWDRSAEAAEFQEDKPFSKPEGKPSAGQQDFLACLYIELREEGETSEPGSPMDTSSQGSSRSRRRSARKAVE